MKRDMSVNQIHEVLKRKTPFPRSATSWYHSFTRFPQEKVTMSEYDASTPKIPRLAGPALRAFATLLETSGINHPLLANVRKNAGVTAFLARPLEEPPLYYPHHHPPSSPPRPTPDLDAWLAAQPETAPPGMPFTRARDFTAAYRAGTLTPTQVAEQIIHAIAAADQGDRPLRAFIASDPEDILRQADASTRRWQEGHPLSPLDGVPVAVKDELDQVPYGTTVGTKFLGTTPAREDATVVARLRAAGAILVGKTNMHEIGISVTGINPHHGTVRNPYNPGHITGGSSSGSAAAVAAGIVPIALGVDGGGSIRIPAALCGVVGLMPTFGRVSEFGSAPLDWSLSHVGVLAASVEDTALAYAVIAGSDPRDSHTHHQPPASLEGIARTDLEGITLGIFPPWFRHAEDPVVAAADAAMERLTQRGARVKEITLPDLTAARSAHAIIILSEMATGMAPYYDAHRKDFGLDVRINLALGRSFAAREYLHAQRMRTRITRHFLAVLEDVDLILTPTVAMTAPPIPEDTLPEGESNLALVIALMRHTFPSNLVGLPSITVPVGYHNGLPIGLQAIGRPWEEHLLLRWAAVLERHIPRQAPRIFFPLEK